MKKEGLTSLFDYSELSIHGYFEAYRNLFRLLSLRAKVINYLLEEKPNIFIARSLQQDFSIPTKEEKVTEEPEALTGQGKDRQEGDRDDEE